MIVRIGLILIIPLLLFGCTITKTNDVRTGLFGNDLEKLSAAYQQIDQLERGKATRKEVEEILGIEFNKKLPPNVERVPGPNAFRRIYGEGAFQGAFVDPKKSRELTIHMNRHRAYFIPFKNVRSYVDRFYFSRKETSEEGDDMLIVLMFESDILIYGDYHYVQIKGQRSESAFAQGLLEILQQYVGPSRALYDFIKEVQDKNKE